ncbi:MAG TPA: hypothetical protein VGG60_14440, partial [Candidatus Binataceae bacterium]
DGVVKIKQLAKAAGRDPAAFDFTVFALEQQFRTKAEIQALQKAGANRVILWILQPELKSIMKELDDLARTVLG